MAPTLEDLFCPDGTEVPVAVGVPVDSGAPTW